MLARWTGHPCSPSWRGTLEGRSRSRGRGRLPRRAPSAGGVAAAEATFVNKDASATLKLGQARGVALLAAAQAGLAVAEYAPNLVKKTIVGAGHGDKAQIRMMIGVLLPKADPQSEDAADALAIAGTHAHHRGAALLRERLGPGPAPKW